MLEALLSGVVRLAIVSLATIPSVQVLPRSPTSVASVAALVLGGDLLDYLAVSTEGDVERARFQLGVGGEPGEERSGIWVVRGSEEEGAIQGVEDGEEMSERLAALPEVIITFKTTTTIQPFKPSEEAPAEASPEVPPEAIPFSLDAYSFSRMVSLPFWPTAKVGRTGAPARAIPSISSTMCGMAVSPHNARRQLLAAID